MKLSRRKRFWKKHGVKPAYRALFLAWMGRGSAIERLYATKRLALFRCYIPLRKDLLRMAGVAQEPTK